MAKHDTPDNRPAAHATRAPTLNKRIEDMEQRLAFERTQAVAHVREFGGNVRRRMTSPTSLVFSAGVGFIAAEIIGSRRRIVHEARRRGRANPKKKQGKSALASVIEPIVPLARIGILGFFTKKNKEMAEQMSDGAEGGSETLH